MTGCHTACCCCSQLQVAAVNILTERVLLSLEELVLGGSEEADGNGPGGDGSGGASAG